MLALLLQCCLPRHPPSYTLTPAGTPTWSISWPSATSHPALSLSTAPAAAWPRCGARPAAGGVAPGRLLVWLIGGSINAPLEQPIATDRLCFNPCASTLCPTPPPLPCPHQVLAAARTDPAVAAHLTWPRRLAMAADAAAGMLYLHTRPSPIVHRGRAGEWAEQWRPSVMLKQCGRDAPSWRVQTRGTPNTLAFLCRLPL